LRHLIAALLLTACAAPAVPTSTDLTDDTDQHVIVPEGFGDVRGRICTPAGDDWVGGAEVSVQGASGDLVTTTNAQGWFTLQAVPAGPQVLQVRSGSFTAQHPVEVQPDLLNELPEPACLGADDLDILVIDGRFDDVGSLLTQLDVPFDVVEAAAAEEILSDGTRLDPYDVILIECGATVHWAQDRPPTALRTWVSEGGSLYASDLTWPVMATMFPDVVQFAGGRPNQGREGSAQAKVQDALLRELLGRDSLNIHLEPGWAVLSGASAGTVLIDGRALLENLEYVHAPLAVRGKVDDGRVLYTSFHQHDLANDDAVLMLRAMLLSL